MIVAIAVVSVPGPALAYIDNPLTLGRVVEYDASNIVVVQVEKVSQEKGVIIYKAVADLKGKSEQPVLRQRVNRLPREEARRQDGGGPRSPILSWAEPGRVAILFSNTAHKVTLTCVGTAWYTGFRRDDGWWDVNEFESRELAWAYLGSVETLRKHLSDILAGKEVVVTAARYDDHGGGSGELWVNRTARSNLGHDTKVRIWRIRASRKILSLRDALADRDHFVVGLGTGDQEAIPALVAALKSKEVSARRLAAEDLGQLGPEGRAAVPALTQALEDADGRVRVSAAEALWEIERKAGNAVPALVAALKDNDAGVRRAAVAALSGIGPDARAAVPSLAAALQDADRDVRRDAARALWRIGPEARSAAAALAAALRDADGNVRRSAAGALGTLGPEARAYLPALSDALKDKDIEVRHFAARALVQVGDRGAKRAAAPVLHELLRHGDRDPRVHAEIIVFLWRIGPEPESESWGLDPGDLIAATLLLTGVYGTEEDTETQKNAVPSLLAAFKTVPAPGHRAALARTLGAIGPAARAAIPALREGLKDQDENVRKAAAEALKKMQSP
jgi:HEAT repeat protein